MSDQIPQPETSPLALAQGAAGAALRLAWALRTALATGTIPDWDEQNVAGMELLPADEARELFGDCDGKVDDGLLAELAAMREEAAGRPPRVFRWATGQLSLLWNFLGVAASTIQAVSATLTRTRREPVAGFQGLGHPNAHEACLGFAVQTCDHLWSLIDGIPDPGSRMPITESDHRWIERRLHERSARIRDALLAPGDLSPLLTCLLASAQVETALAGAPPQPAHRPENTSLRGIDGETLALAVLMKNPTWSDSQIARAVGVHRGSLYRWDKYLAAKAALRADGGGRKRYRRTPDGSDYEELDDE